MVLAYQLPNGQRIITVARDYLRRYCRLSEYDTDQILKTEIELSNEYIANLYLPNGEKLFDSSYCYVDYENDSRVVYLHLYPHPEIFKNGISDNPNFIIGHTQVYFRGQYYETNYITTYDIERKIQLHQTRSGEADSRNAERDLSIRI